jgi:hypothetical protein
MSMLWELIGLLVRQALLLLTNWIAANPEVAKFLGPDVVAFIQREQTIAQIVAGVITLLITGWQVWRRIRNKAEKQVLAHSQPTTIVEAKAEVKHMSTGEKISLAFKDEKPAQPEG